MGSLVSLVMSDIVDSTRRWNAAEGAMAADLELHDRLIREVVEGAGGSVFKHTGDGMIAVFDDPVAAAGAAAGIQQAIGRAQWQHPDGLRVRAAVHTGVVYPRDGDLFGTAVNKVARLLGVCPPGAVLVSGATTALLADRAPEGLVLRPVGAVSLAGFATPDDAHALVGAGLGPVGRIGDDDTGAVAAGRLPPVEAELVGRADEVAAIWDALGKAPLVTLVGVGGMGKTRLALEVAAGAVAAYDGAVWWIDLANATTADAVIQVAMAAVGALETPGRTPLQSLCDRFTGVTGLVVVDNCEHVLGAAREMVTAVMNDCPRMRVVATSREALGSRREHLVPVGSLPIDDSVVLFSERAQAVRPDLDTVADAAVIERICTRLDGIPLAIELAAARCRSMTPAEIDGLLDDRFRLLRGGRDGAERHRTLQAAVAWSYELLDPDERTVFDQMAVFAAGTLIDGVVAVTGFDRFDALDLVDRLVARSMVVATRTPLGTRYHQLETLRQYAEDRLVEAGTIAQVRDRHLGWVSDVAASIGAATGIEAHRMALARFTAEVDNLRVAVAHATHTNQHPAAHRMVGLVGDSAVNTGTFAVFDWARPIRLGDGWTADAAACHVWGEYADIQRTNRPATVESTDLLPDWWHTASFGTRSFGITNHLTSGGDVRVALALLDMLDVQHDYEQVVIDSTRLYASWLGQQTAALSDHELNEMVALASSTVARARQFGHLPIVFVSLMSSTLALSLERPLLAAAYGGELVEIAERVNARSWLRYGRALLAGVPANDALSTTEVRALQRELKEALDRKEQMVAGVAGSALLRVAAPLDTDVALRLWWVWRRVTSVDRRRDFAAYGVAVPDDPQELDELERRTANQSLIDVLRELLDVVDRWLDEAEAEAEAERPDVAAAGGEG